MLIFHGCDKKGSWADDRVILISIDGLQGEIILHPEKYGFKTDDLPHFSRLKNMGSYSGQVQTIFPSQTYPAHTSIITGEVPPVHGIINNRPFAPESNFSDWYWFADSIKVPTLIDKAYEKKLITLSISWPVTVGAPATYMLAEIQSTSDSVSTLDLVRKYDVPNLFLEKAKIRGAIRVDKTPKDYDRDLLLHQLFLDSFKRYRPHLSLYHIIQTDYEQHDFGKISPEVKKAYVFADSLIGNILSLIDINNLWDTTTLIVTGDHGFKNHDKGLNVNRLFADKGWLTIDNNGQIENWDVVCLSSGGSAFVRLIDSTNEAFKKDVQLMLAQQSEFELFENRHLIGILSSGDKEDFVLLAKDGFSFIRNNKKPYIYESLGGNHGGNPSEPTLFTGFMSAGRGVQKNVNIGQMASTQIAPFVSDLLLLGLNCNAKPINVSKNNN